MIEDVTTFGEQRVRMTRLGSASSSRSTVGQNVSLDHRDAGEGVGKDSGGQQSTDGCTEDYGLPTDCPHQNSQPFDPYCRPCWVRACGERISGPPRPAVNSPTPYLATTAYSCQHGARSRTKPRRWREAAVGNPLQPSVQSLPALAGKSWCGG